jgi:hypothetical protein
MMSRTTSEGAAPVALLAELFDLSRAAYYQALRGGKQVSATTAKKEPKPARFAAAAVVAAIRVIVGEHRAWGVRKVWAMLRREHVQRSHEPQQ